MPLRRTAFAIEKEGVTMWDMAATFVFEGGKAEAFGSGGTLAEASAELPAGSYTTLRTYGGTGVVRLARHGQRLVESLPPARQTPLEPERLRAALVHALRETGHA